MYGGIPYFANARLKDKQNTLSSDSSQIEKSLSSKEKQMNEFNVKFAKIKMIKQEIYSTSSSLVRLIQNLGRNALKSLDIVKAQCIEELRLKKKIIEIDSICSMRMQPAVKEITDLFSKISPKIDDLIAENKKVEPEINVIKKSVQTNEKYLPPPANLKSPEFDIETKISVPYKLKVATPINYASNDSKKNKAVLDIKDYVNPLIAAKTNTQITEKKNSYSIPKVTSVSTTNREPTKKNLSSTLTQRPDIPIIGIENNLPHLMPELLYNIEKGSTRSDFPNRPVFLGKGGVPPTPPMASDAHPHFIKIPDPPSMPNIASPNSAATNVPPSIINALKTIPADIRQFDNFKTPKSKCFTEESNLSTTFENWKYLNENGSWVNFSYQITLIIENSYRNSETKLEIVDELKKYSIFFSIEEIHRLVHQLDGKIVIRPIKRSNSVIDQKILFRCDWKFQDRTGKLTSFEYDAAILLEKSYKDFAEEKKSICVVILLGKDEKVCVVNLGKMEAYWYLGDIYTKVIRNSVD